MLVFLFSSLCPIFDAGSHDISIAFSMLDVSCQLNRMIILQFVVMSYQLSRTITLQSCISTEEVFFDFAPGIAIAAHRVGRFSQVRRMSHNLNTPIMTLIKPRSIPH